MIARRRRRRRRSRRIEWISVGIVVFADVA